MPAYGPTPLGESNGTSLGVAYVRVATNNLGVITGREYWCPAIQDWEPGPRVDARHITPHQRLSTDTTDVDNTVQLSPTPRLAIESANVLAVVYNIDATGKATGVYRVSEHNIVVALASINGTY